MVRPGSSRDCSRPFMSGLAADYLFIPTRIMHIESVRGSRERWAGFLIAGSLNQSAVAISLHMDSTPSGDRAAQSTGRASRQQCPACGGADANRDRPQGRVPAMLAHRVAQSTGTRAQCPFTSCERKCRRHRSLNRARDVIDRQTGHMARSSTISWTLRDHTEQSLSCAGSPSSSVRSTERR